MRIARTHAAAVIVVLALGLVLAVAALAAMPVAGGKYTGSTTNKEKVILTISTSSNRSGDYTVKCKKHESLPTIVTIDKNGSFSGPGLSGKFKSSKKAKATLGKNVCGKGGKLTLKLQQKKKK